MDVATPSGYSMDYFAHSPLDTFGAKMLQQFSYHAPRCLLWAESILIRDCRLHIFIVFCCIFCSVHWHRTTDEVTCLCIVFFFLYLLDLPLRNICVRRKGNVLVNFWIGKLRSPVYFDFHSDRERCAIELLIFMITTKQWDNILMMSYGRSCLYVS